MLISIVLAWIATACAILTALKIIVKKNKKINKIFHKIHIPCGIILIVTGLIHGLIAGNPLGTSIDKISVGSTFLTFNFGTISFVIGILLGLSYLFRKVLRNTSIKWIVIHRILTLGLVLTVIIHVFQVGISLPNAISKTVSGVNLETLGNSSKDTTVSGTSSFSGANLKDGTYEGSAEGYKSTIKVSVTVENGTVTLIKIMDENETPQYIQRAESIIDNIINNIFVVIRCKHQIFIGQRSTYRFYIDYSPHLAVMSFYNFIHQIKLFDIFLMYDSCNHHLLNPGAYQMIHCL